MTGNMERPGKQAGRFAGIRPKGLALTAEAPVRRDLLRSASTGVAAFAAADGALDLADWVDSRREAIAEALREHGAVLFRGFRPLETEDVARLAENLGGPAASYQERSSPRRQVADRVYTSTEYPAYQEIFFHNENSYATSWPGRLLFVCVRPAATGGQTPLADVRAVCRRIPATLRRRFQRKGLSYTRYFGGVLGLGWREAFQQESLADAVGWARDHGYEAEALEGDRLRTRRRAPAILRRPLTGEPVWFNHAAFFHPSTLPPAIREGLLAQAPEDDWPYHVCFGDLSPIDDEEIAVVREAYRAEALDIDWQAGDALLLDNMTVAHGRRAFTGDRRVLVAMTDLMHSGQSKVPAPQELEL